MYRLEPSMVVHGVRMIYVPVMPTHRKRVTQTYVHGTLVWTCKHMHSHTGIHNSHTHTHNSLANLPFCRMQKLLKVPSDTKYVDLTLSFVNPDPSGGDDIAGPPIRYYFK